jgi:putative transposase
MRTAYKVRAYPDPDQAAVLARTFGCVRVVWNQTLAARHACYQAEGKTCSACGHLLAELSLGTRRWTCPGCGTLHDRDHNAAKNVLAAAGLAADACGAGVRHGRETSVQSAVKQEPLGVSPGIPVLQGGE